MSHLIRTHNYLYCALRSLQEVLTYDDDLVAMLYLDFTVGIAPCQCCCFPCFFHLTSSTVMTDQQIQWDGKEAKLDPQNPEKEVTGQNK